MWKTLKEFVRSVGKWGWAVTIDWLIGAGLGTAQSFGHATVLPRWTPYAIVAVGFVVACFIAFHRIRIERDEAIERLSEHQPNFRAQLVQIGYADFSNNEIKSATSIFVVMSIANRVHPSIACKFSVGIKYSDGQIIYGIPFWTTKDDISIPSDKGPPRILKYEQYLPTIAMTPIPRGGIILGYVSVVFPGMKKRDVQHLENKLLVEFDDINDKRFTCEYVYGQLSDPSPPHPGEMAFNS